MTRNEKIISAVFWAVVLVAAYMYFFNEDRRAANVEAKQSSAQKVDQRMSQGAYVESEKNISHSETVRILVVPGRSSALDTKCLIYTHQDFKQSNMACPDDIGLRLSE